MATGNGRKTGSGTTRAGSTRKRPASAKRNTNTKGAESEPLDHNLKSEIVFISMMAVVIFLFLCNFQIMGKVGASVSRFMFGVFGLPAYITPIFLFFIIYFGISNAGSFVAGRKVFAWVVLYLMAGITCDMISFPLSAGSEHDIKEIYARGLSEESRRVGGGLLGGSLYYLLFKYLGSVGIVLLQAVLVIISFVILTNRSFMSGVKSGGERIYRFSREDAAIRREQNRIRREEMAEEKRRNSEEQENEKILRRDKVVRGVMQDVKLTDSVNENRKFRDDMHEITLNDFDDRLNGEIDFDKVKIHGNFSEDAGKKADDEIRISGDELHRSIGYADEEANVTKRKEVKEPPSAGNDIAREIDSKNAVSSVPKKYIFPPINKLSSGKAKNKGDQTRELKETAARLQQTLLTFGVKVTMTEISQGPAVTRYEMQPDQGVKVSKIVSLQDDIKLNLAATDIRIEAPIPGKAAIGIEVPNKENTMVAFRDLIESREFSDFPSDIAFAVGKDIGGQIIVSDIARMPHMLIAGATGSGKSVCINTLIMSILYKAHPDNVKLIMIDPKVVELSVYNGIPHLLIPVVTDPKKAASALHWGVAEMTDRYQKFADYNVRDLKGYNKKIAELKYNDDPENIKPLPQIVIIVDELADLMMVAPGEVEESICRLAQLARAAGI
ncbi:MAG: DNA translocase FtsK, partial [Lachnospiraceae bacterium]|nr:DNA translocase FtsK [Lachnospiraceae bacterium]